MPQIGRCDIVTTFDGRPALVNRTVELRLVRFDEMIAEMALAEGEDKSLEDWRAGHERYYRRLGVFEVVEDLGAVD